MNIILASKSPRRKELLQQIDLEFECIPAVGEEKISRDICPQLYEECKDSPKGQVRLLAIQKAREIFEKAEDSIIIAADTVVDLDGCILGKPRDEDDAKKMLRMLSGKKHQVHTGVCIIKKCDGREDAFTSFAETTDVYFKEMTEDEIEKYVLTKEPLDKAGSYGIQGKAAIFITKIVGDYNNVVGLPLSRVYNELKQII